MAVQTKEVVVGDVVNWELPNYLCRKAIPIKRVLAATKALVVGECMEPATAVAQIHTITTFADAPTADGGTYRLGYKGQWTTALAWDANAAAIKAAFELLSLVTDTITASAAFGTTVTITWTTAGQKDEIGLDARLLLDGTVAMTSATLTVTTPGSAATDNVIIATGGNVNGILLEKVTLEDLKTLNNIKRTFLVEGDAEVNGNNLYTIAAQLAAAKTALVALGIRVRAEATIYQVGVPVS